MLKMCLNYFNPFNQNQKKKNDDQNLNKNDKGPLFYDVIVVRWVDGYEKSEKL